MDSLLYVGAADGDDSEEEGEEEGEEEDEASEAGPSATVQKRELDFAALQRAGYESKSNLTQTATYKRLEEAEREAREKEAEGKAAAREEEARRAAAAEELRSELLNRKAIDQKLGYKKRFDETGEGFRQKEKRKRELGQQNRDGNWVEEEKRRIRHASTNFDS
ncbi:hypothetical protein AB1Y20_005983 [Prymnesium parvum]|uniref:Pre-mRNA-splicing factor SYF2 n=1 Tax=Prymnesium parvum TaxID=97485 RepID=A0AB34J1A5_PRYPA